MVHRGSAHGFAPVYSIENVKQHASHVCAAQHSSISGPHWIHAEQHAIYTPLCGNASSSTHDKPVCAVSATAELRPLQSLTLLHRGSCHQGIYTNGSASASGKYTEDAYADKWQCRRAYTQRMQHLTALMNKLEKRLMRRKLAAYFSQWQSTEQPEQHLFCMRSETLRQLNKLRTLCKAFGAWKLWVSWLDPTALQRKGRRLQQLLRYKLLRIQRAAMQQWLDKLVQLRRARWLKQRSIDKWRIAAVQSVYNRTWGMLSVCKLIAAAWLKHTAFHRLLLWKTRRAAARTLLHRLRLRQLALAWQQWLLQAQQKKLRAQQRLYTAFDTWYKRVQAGLKWARHLREQRLLKTCFCSLVCYRASMRLLRSSYNDWYNQLRASKALKLARMLRNCRRACLRAAWRKLKQKYDIMQIICIAPSSATSTPRRALQKCRCVRCLSR
jgi:hypothetical protein